ncbi:MAG: TlpA disulfide reductase family protein [Algibacter sp.]|uniref:TlpA disulfide reductase family protein n=1 Tax=Algibacter sp. TaxID=1872428 RepID=UPI00329864A7
MKLIKILIAALLVFSCETKIEPLKDGTYNIKGMVSNMENGTLFLASPKNNTYLVDTIFVTNGTFNYEGTIDRSVQVILISKNKNDYSMDSMAKLFVEPERMELKLDVNNITSAKLLGSKAQVEADKLNDLKAQVDEKFKSELDAFNANRKMMSTAITDDDKKKYKWKDDELRTKLEPYFLERDAVVKQFVIDNPSSYTSFQNIIFIIEDFEQKEVRAIFDKFPEEYKKDPIAERIDKQISDMNKGIPGVMAGDFNTIDINGKPITLTDFKGQYLLIDFWASWCVPCRKGNPHLLDIYSKYKSHGLEILGVSDDDRNPDAWRKAVKDDKIGVWRHVLRGMKVDRSNGMFNVLDDGVSRGYNISSLPTKILVGPDGIIIGRYNGQNEEELMLDEKLAEIFGIQ